jgi:heme/copper-type cytochrome/quinol oxidase subunit 4
VNDHFLLMVIFSALVSLVFVFLMKNGAQERIRYFLYLFGSFVLLSVLAGWIMYPFPF